jgi:formamidopyrimidine-DNA glycosylase
MPELPEVQTVADDLQVHLVGRTITGVTVYWHRTIARLAVEEFVGQVCGRQVRQVSRRGKYLVIGLDRGHLLIHLKMSGRLHIVPAHESPGSHDRVVFGLDDGRQLRFTDTRKFGRIYLVDDPQEVTAELGPEPLDDGFTLGDFRRLLARRKGRLKPLLLNQRFRAGLGNIYADETLFAARLHPQRRADSLTPAEQARLYEAIRVVLNSAVEGRGTTLSDGGYTDASGQAGTYQFALAVYDRTGKPCPRCKTPVERIVLSGRSAHFCPICQLE